MADFTNKNCETELTSSKHVNPNSEALIFFKQLLLHYTDYYFMIVVVRGVESS